MAGIGLLFGWQSIPFILFVSAVLALTMVLPSLINKKEILKQNSFWPYILLE